MEREASWTAAFTWVKLRDSVDYRGGRRESRNGRVAIIDHT